VLADLAWLFGAPSGWGGLISARRPVLNQDFTVDALRAGLGARPQVVHIASHYKFRPRAGAGKSQAPSVLVLGRETVTVDDFARLTYGAQTDIDLMVLSACETVLARQFNDPSDYAGAEIDGLAEVAHRNGAAAVLASLWRVNDNSAPHLLWSFYQGLTWFGGSPTKSASLRNAQLKMIREEVGPDMKKPCGWFCGWFQARPKGDRTLSPWPGWTHPYYWGAFMLLGNWR
jgi:CHAT domain-containing protein